jgi:hypothetical protein
MHNLSQPRIPANIQKEGVTNAFVVSIQKGREPLLSLVAILLCRLMLGASTSHAADKKPNILVIMGDDVGWFNVEPYHQGIMSGKTPNLSRGIGNSCGSAR